MWKEKETKEGENQNLWEKKEKATELNKLFLMWSLGMFTGFLWTSLETTEIMNLNDDVGSIRKFKYKITPSFNNFVRIFKY